MLSKDAFQYHFQFEKKIDMIGDWQKNAYQEYILGVFFFFEKRI